MPNGARISPRIAAGIAVLAGALAGTVSAELGDAAETPRAAQVPERAVLRYEPRDDGLLRVRVEINGQSVPVVLDSGADRIYLSDGLAKRLGLEPTGRWREMTTGSGEIRTDLHRVGRLTIAGHELRDLVAGVAPGLTYALVGQSVLSCFKWSVDPGARTVELERVRTSSACEAAP